MSEQKHTPEPWIVTGADRIKYIEARVGNGILQEIASCMIAEYGTHEANARRIVACVNAMAGIDDPELWVAQCDDLLAACKAVIEYCDNNPPNGDTLWCVQMCRDAIAKAEGKS